MLRHADEHKSASGNASAFSASGSSAGGGVSVASSKRDDKMKYFGKETKSLASFTKKHIVLAVFLVGVLIYLCMRSAATEFDKWSRASANGILSVKPKCLNAHTLLTADGIDSKCSPQMQRALLYCNEKLVAGSEGSGIDSDSAAQSHFPKADGFELVHLTMLIRHGDRTAIHAMPGGNMNQYSASDVENASGRGVDGWLQGENGLQHPVHGNKYLDVRALEFVPNLLNFATHVLPAPAANGTRAVDSLPQPDEKVLEHQHREHPPTRPIPDALNSEVIFSVGDTELPPGRLTSRGFMQHVVLGQALHKAYSPFLASNVHSVDHVHVRSTNYERTIQSVAAFLIGLVPDQGGGVNPIQIGVFETDSDEIMHGVPSRCTSAAAGAKKEKVAFVLDDHVKARMGQLFSADKENSAWANPGDVDTTFVTDMADAALARMCHNQPLPCGVGYSEACMNEEDLGELVAQADRAFCDRYSGTRGGLSSTKLNVYPFLEEIIGGLMKQANATDKEKTKMPLTVFSGHDTVIAPVLAGLGLYRDRCDWPQYASRIAFELWRHSTATADTATTPLQHFVRIVYNGKDLTSDVPVCKGANPCPLEAVQAQVAELLADHPTLKDACSK